MKVTMDQFQALIEEAAALGATRRSDPGFTRRDYEEASGLSETQATRHIRALVRAGRLKSGRRYEKDINGFDRPVPVYMPVEQS